MPIDIVEIFWRCRACNNKNLGRFKSCTSCSKTKDDLDEEILPEDPGPGRGVKDPGLLKQFTSGPDWVCKYCKSHQKKTDGSCANCGANQDGGRSRDRPPTAPTPAPPEIEFEDRATGYRQAPRPKRRPTILFEELPPEPTRSRQRARSVGTMVGVFLGIATAGLLIWLLVRPRIYDTTVDSVAWKHVVIIDRYAVFHGEGFDEDRPASAFNVISLGQHVHHHDRVIDHYETRIKTRQVPDGQSCTTIRGTCTTTPRSCSNNKNGSMTCSGGDRQCSPDYQSCTPKYRTESYPDPEPVYRDDPIYRTWYAWDNWEWHPNRRIEEAGSGTETYWPSPEKTRLNQGLAQGEQERDRKEATYSVVFRDGNDRYDYTPGSLSEFQRYAPASRFRIEVRTLGGVRVLSKL